MEAYQYKAIDDKGRIHNGKVDAVNIADLEARLVKMGLDMINYKELLQRPADYRRRCNTPGFDHLLFPP